MQLIKSHILRATTESRNSFEEYDALWLAFNVMYEGTRQELLVGSIKSPSELDMIKHCVKKLDYKVWNQLFKVGKLEGLFSISPIFNDRDWLRKARINTREYDNLVKTAKRELSGEAKKDEELLGALVGLLYVVRCNRSHGFKTPLRKRDREVLDVVVPLLRELVIKIAAQFGDRNK